MLFNVWVHFLFLSKGDNFYDFLFKVPDDKALQECRGWSGGAMVLGKLPVPGRRTYLD